MHKRDGLTSKAIQEHGSLVYPISAFVLESQSKTLTNSAIHSTNQCASLWRTRSHLLRKPGRWYTSARWVNWGCGSLYIVQRRRTIQSRKERVEGRRGGATAVLQRTGEYLNVLVLVGMQNSDHVA